MFLYVLIYYLSTVQQRAACETMKCNLYPSLRPIVRNSSKRVHVFVDAKLIHDFFHVSYKLSSLCVWMSFEWVAADKNYPGKGVGRGPETGYGGERRTAEGVAVRFIDVISR